MSHGTHSPDTELTPAEKRLLETEAASAERLERLAKANVEDAANGLALARLALDRATENRRTAFRRAYGHV